MLAEVRLEQGRLNDAAALATESTPVFASARHVPMTHLAVALHALATADWPTVEARAESLLALGHLLLALRMRALLARVTGRGLVAVQVDADALGLVAIAASLARPLRLPPQQ